MMKKIGFIFLFVSIFGISQEKKNLNQGVYFTTDVQLGFGLKKVVADIINDENSVPLNSNFGATSVLGFQPIHKIGFGAGLRYNNLSNQINHLFFLVQPKLFFGDVTDAGFLYLNVGIAINKNDVKSARFYTLGIGDQNPINSRMNYYYSLFLENQRMDLGFGLKNNLYIGLNFGITFHTNKVRD